MAHYKKSKFSASTREKHSKLKYKKRTILLHKDAKKKVIRKKRKPLTAIAKKLFRSNAPVDKQRKGPKKAIIAGVFGLTLFIIYLLFFTSIFEVKSIEIYEGEEISDNVNLRKFVEPLRGRNLFLIKPEIIQESLKDKIDNLYQLRVSKDFPSTIVISFARFKKVANITNIVGQQGIRKNFIINEVGILMQEDSVGQNLPFINVETDNTLAIGDQAISQETLDYILGAISLFEEKINIKVNEVNLLSKAREVHLITERGFEVWLDREQNYENQIDKLRNAIPKINPYEESFAYIDLRIQSAQGQKIIYRRR